MKKKIIIAVAVIIMAAVSYWLYENQLVDHRVRAAADFNINQPYRGGDWFIVEGMNDKHLRVSGGEYTDHRHRDNLMRSMHYTMSYLRSIGFTQIIISDGNGEWVFKL